jgi:hypothetical protein
MVLNVGENAFLDNLRMYWERARPWRVESCSVPRISSSRAAPFTCPTQTRDIAGRAGITVFNVGRLYSDMVT